MCPTGKIPYPSPQHAWHTAARIRHRIRSNAADRRQPNVAAYQCPFCGHWHTTSKGRA